MSLKRKFVLTLAVVFAMLAGMTYAVQKGIVFPHFTRLEREEAVKNVNRCVEDISREIEHLSILCQDWAAWNDSYQFMEDGNQEFADANLVTETLVGAKLNLLAFYDVNGDSVWCQLFDVDGETFIDDPGFLETIRDNRLLSVHESIGSSRSGVILTSRGPLLVASHPILNSQHEGPSRGSLVMGRFFGDEQVSAVMERTRVGLRLWPLNIELPEHERAIIRKVSSTNPNGVVEGSDEYLHAYASYADLNGKPALLLRADLPREITARGTSAMRYAMLTTLLGGGAILLITWAILHRTVVGPLQQVTDHAVALGKNDDLFSRLDMSRDDEIGSLAREFDQMVVRLHESRTKMLDTAHRAGMADLAGEVLHNIGNALNTVCMSTDEIGEQLRESKVEGYRKAVTLIRENESHLAEFFHRDERGRKVLTYLFKLSDVFAAEHEQLTREYQTLREKVEQIRGIIRAQQTCAARTELIEFVSLPSVFDDVLTVQQRPIERAKVKLVRQLDDGVPVLRANRNKLTQVLVHLVRNAVESISARGDEQDRTLTLRAATTDGGRVRIEVIDTGVGIEPQHMEKLFRGGHTTKPNGHGMGLHFCANAVKAMDGTIAAHSDGANRGAAFVIELSEKTAEVKA